jgi:hypothetical protein
MKVGLSVNSPPPRKFTRLAIAIIIAAVLVSATLVASNNIQKTETITSNSTSTATVTDTATDTQITTEATTITVSPNSAVVDSSISDNLQLDATIQPTSSPYGQNITIIATILDVGSTTFQMNATGLVNPVYGPCPQYFATGVYVYSGYYSSGNVSKATQLPLYNPNAIYGCPTQSILSYTFQPLRGLTEVSVLTGDWSGSRFQSFPIGEYTVSVFDAWGQVAIGHFEVLPSGQSSTSSTSSTCSGYPPVGNCPDTYSYTFTVSVNYTGPWKLTYLGYNNLGITNPTNVSGSYTGTGFFAKNVTMTSVDTGGLTLCAQAQKLDASTAALILTVTGYNETSLPYGSVSYCGGVVP